MTTASAHYPTRELVWAEMGPKGEAIWNYKSFDTDTEAMKFCADLEDTLDEGTFEVLGTATLH